MAISRTELNRNQVYNYLLDAITTGKIKANEKIVESKYTALLEVSRTPVREALRMLENDKLVVHIPQRGVYARSLFTKKEIREIFFLRRTLQMATVEGTVENATEDEIENMSRCLAESERCLAEQDYDGYIQFNNGFNTGLIDACHIDIVANTIRHSEQTGPRISFTEGNGSSSEYMRIKGRFVDSLAEHKAILNALKNRDIEEFRKALSVHIDNVEASFLEIAEE